MKRSFGMMPASEVFKKQTYRDDSNLEVIIQAGPHGWAILWADITTTYADNDATTEENFNQAYKEAVNCVGELAISNSNSIRETIISDC